VEKSAVKAFVAPGAWKRELLWNPAAQWPSAFALQQGARQALKEPAKPSSGNSIAGVRCVDYQYFLFLSWPPSIRAVGAWRIRGGPAVALIGEKRLRAKPPCSLLCQWPAAAPNTARIRWRGEPMPISAGTRPAEAKRGAGVPKTRAPARVAPQRGTEDLLPTGWFQPGMERQRNSLAG